MPVVKDGDVLVRVHAVSVNPLDWHFLRGHPYLARPSSGWRKPKRNIPGVDVAGVVEAVGKNVTRFKPGDEVFGEKSRACAEYVCGPGGRCFVPKPAGSDVRAGGRHSGGGGHGPAGAPRQGAGPAGPEGPDQRRVRRRRDVRGPDRQGARCRRDRRVQHGEHRPGPLDRRRPGHRLHPRRLHPGRTALRPDHRQRRQPFAAGTQARPCADRDPRVRRRAEGQLDPRPIVRCLPGHWFRGSRRSGCSHTLRTPAGEDLVPRCRSSSSPAR